MLNRPLCRSTTHKRWQTLVINAYALSEADNLSGKAIYRMRIRSVSPDQLVFDTENISTISYFLMPLYRPGDMQSIYFFERESKDVWRY